MDVPTHLCLHSDSYLNVSFVFLFCIFCEIIFCLIFISLETCDCSYIFVTIFCKYSSQCFVLGLLALQCSFVFLMENGIFFILLDMEAPFVCFALLIYHFGRYFLTCFTCRFLTALSFVNRLKKTRSNNG